MSSTTTAGTLVISLDFELMWGMFDKVTHQSYGAQLDGVHTVVPRLLELFREYEIHATWATVGMLAAANADELERLVAGVTAKPAYQDQSLSAYEHIAHHDCNDYPEHYFAPHLIEQIVATPHQELASHTFSHYYCLEEQSGGETGAASFAADCAALTAALSPFGQTPTSIVFPRNQWSEAALETATEHSLTAFRGTESHAIYKPQTEVTKTALWRRALRFLDRYVDLTGHHTYAKPIQHGGLFNVPASRQLHPYSHRLRFLEPHKRRRIKAGMTHAAKTGEIFHLWWHPHNFGAHQTENLELLTDLLQHFSMLRDQYGMQSKSMRELATTTDAAA